MRQSDRGKLHFGPYHTPRFRIGAKVQCAVRGELVIVGITDGRIPWPVGRHGRGRSSLVVFRDLARAVTQESHVAIVYWWEVALDVPLSNPGTHRLRARYAKSPLGELARAAAVAKAGDPKRRSRISAAKLGRKPSAAAVAKMRAKLSGRKLSAEHRRRISLGCNRPKLVSVLRGLPIETPWPETARASDRSLRRDDGEPFFTSQRVRD